MSSAILDKNVAEKQEDLFERDDEEDDIFSDNQKFGAIVDDYKRVMKRANPKTNTEMLSIGFRSRKGTVAPFSGETEMTDLNADASIQALTELSSEVTLFDFTNRRRVQQAS